MMFTPSPRTTHLSLPREYPRKDETETSMACPPVPPAPLTAQSSLLPRQERSVNSLPFILRTAIVRIRALLSQVTGISMEQRLAGETIRRAYSSRYPPKASTPFSIYLGVPLTAQTLLAPRSKPPTGSSTVPR